MSSLTVTVLTPHGRRQNVKVGPNMTLLQILEEVCKKYDFKSEEHCLKHHNKELDLTQMFRFSGLPNKCLLEMEECNKKREDSEVVICIQFQDGARQQGQFYPDQTLKDVLQKLNPNCLKENPVIIYMRTELYGDMFENTTLKCLGITKGRAMFRILNKNPEDLKKQANVYIPAMKPVPSPSEEEEDEPKSKPKPKKNENNLCKSVGITSEKIRSVIPKTDKKDEDERMNEDEDSTKKEEENESPPKKPEYDWGSSVGRKMNEKIISVEENNQKDEEMIEEPEIFVLGERNAVVFSLNSAQKGVDDIPDSFFDLTIDDIKMLLRDLRKEATGNEDAPLLTAKLREIEETNRQLKKLGQYKKSVIRIQFPDRMVLQGTFNPTDKIEDVYDFVRNYLKNPDSNFHLFTIPPKKILDRNITLLEADYLPTAILHFGIDEDGDEEKKNENHDSNQKSYLKDDLKQTSANGAILAASKSRGLTEKRLTDEDMEDDQPGPSSGRRPTACTGAIPKQPKPGSFKKSTTITESSSGKVPKWFKPVNK